jgi:hypothetical protein
LAQRCALRLKAKRCALAEPLGEAGRFRSANMKIFADFSYSPGFAYWRSTNYSANSIGAA